MSQPNSAINYLSRDKLGFGFFIAAAAHALVVFGMTFDWREPSDSAPTLDVTLVTHRSDLAPDEADFIAQANQQASGTEDQAMALTTDRLSDFAGDERGDPSPLESRAGTAVDQQRQELLSQANIAAEPSGQQPGDSPVDQAASSEASALQARLDALRQELAKRPRIGTLTSVAARSSEDAAYQLVLQERIVLTGNRHYPEEALAKEIFGSLRLQLTILPDGRLESADVLESSGQPILDRAAVEIARQAGPFEPFPPAVRAKYDKIVFIRTWQFLPGGVITSL